MSAEIIPLRGGRSEDEMLCALRTRIMESTVAALEAINRCELEEAAMACERARLHVLAAMRDTKG